MQVDVVSGLFGWLLGLLSPGIAARIERGYRRRELTAPLLAELDELRFNLVLALFRLRAFLGTLDAPAAARLSEVAQSYRGLEVESPELKLLRNPAAALADAEARPTIEGRALAVKPYSLQLLSANMSEITVCEPDLQRRLLHIRAELELYNADVALASQEFERSFSGGLDTAKSAIVAVILKQHYGRLAKRAQDLVDAATTALARHRR